MPTGIQIIGNAGNILIDENYKNVALRQKGTATLGAGGSVKLMGRYFADFTGAAAFSTPRVAVACATGYVCCDSFSYNSVTNIWRFRFTGTPGQSFTYYIFDDPQNLSLGYGMQVFNAAGELTFDSANKYARVRDFINTTGLSNIPRTDTYDSGRVYAAMYLNQPSRTIRNIRNHASCGLNEVQNWLEKFYGMTKIVGNVVEHALIKYYDDGEWGDCESRDYKGYTNSKQQSAIIDVTNY